MNRILPKEELDQQLKDYYSSRFGQRDTDRCP